MNDDRFPELLRELARQAALVAADIDAACSRFHRHLAERRAALAAAPDTEGRGGD